MPKSSLPAAIDHLGNRFADLDLSFHPLGASDVTSFWPGGENEEILVCVFKGHHLFEPFHRQDFFFVNYAYQNSYEALSETYDNPITIEEGACYIGQPYSGYAIRVDGAQEVVIFGVLIRRDTFFRQYLPTVSTDTRLLRFFLEPQGNRFSSEYIHLPKDSDPAIEPTLENMVLEYAAHGEGDVLKSMLQTLFLAIARGYAAQKPESAKTLPRQILDYIAGHMDTVTLQTLAARFHYHPAYLSALLKRETGHTFTQILTQNRMDRALLLLQNTHLTIDEIFPMLGFSDRSSFYRTFKEHYGQAPREYLKTIGRGGE